MSNMKMARYVVKIMVAIERIIGSVVLVMIRIMKIVIR